MTKPKTDVGSLFGGFHTAGIVSGPIGAVNGAFAGIVGGMMGRRKQRSDAHYKAVEEWEQLRTGYEVDKAAVEGRAEGDLRSEIERLTAELKRRYGVLPG